MVTRNVPLHGKGIIKSDFPHIRAKDLAGKPLGDEAVTALPKKYKLKSMIVIFCCENDHSHKMNTFYVIP